MGWIKDGSVHAVVGYCRQSVTGSVFWRQVYDLSVDGPKPGLQLFKNVANARILACGGDGTVAWVLSAIDEVFLGSRPQEMQPVEGEDEKKVDRKGLRNRRQRRQNSKPHAKKPSFRTLQQRQYLPPVAVLPLGTGNDLARSLGWGGGYAGERVSDILSEVAQAHVTLLDRWVVEVTSKKSGAVLGRKRVLNNYLGVGMDAWIAKKFHSLREAMPHQFGSQLQNKMW